LSRGDENHFIQAKGNLDFAGCHQVAVVNGVKRAAHNPNAWAVTARHKALVVALLWGLALRFVAVPVGDVAIAENDEGERTKDTQGDQGKVDGREN
jgi:hypothetical protein